MSSSFFGHVAICGLTQTTAKVGLHALHFFHLLLRSIHCLCSRGGGRRFHPLSPVLRQPSTGKCPFEISAHEPDREYLRLRDSSLQLVSTFGPVASSSCKRRMRLAARSSSMASAVTVFQSQRGPEQPSWGTPCRGPKLPSPSRTLESGRLVSDHVESRICLECLSWFWSPCRALTLAQGKVGQGVEFRRGASAKKGTKHAASTKRQSSQRPGQVLIISDFARCDSGFDGTASRSAQDSRLHPQAVQPHKAILPKVTLDTL